MECSKDGKILLVICFLDSLINGIVVPLIAPHMTMHGANQIDVGILVSGIFLCQMLSGYFIALYDDHGKKFAVTLFMFTSFAMYMIMIFTVSYKLVLLLKFIHTLISQTDKTCKAMIAEIEPSDSHERLFTLVDILTVTGNIVGPIIGGYVFDWRSDFGHNLMIAVILTLTSMLLVQQLDTLNSVPVEKSAMTIIHQIPTDCVSSYNTLRGFDYKSHWDTILLKIAYTASFTIFNTKYPLLITYNYHVGTVVIGYTVAYQNMLVFASGCLLPLVKEEFGPSFSKKRFFEHSLLISSATLIGTYYAPTHECYLMVFIPMIVSRTTVNDLWTDALGLDGNKELARCCYLIGNVLLIVVPFVFGFVTEYAGVTAFKLFCILPPAVCLHILNQRFLNPKVVVVVEEDSGGPSVDPVDRQDVDGGTASSKKDD